MMCAYDKGPAGTASETNDGLDLMCVAREGPKGAPLEASMVEPTCACNVLLLFKGPAGTKGKACKTLRPGCACDGPEGTLTVESDVPSEMFAGESPTGTPGE